MATSSWNKFQDFSDQLIRGVHDFDAHTFKVALTNAAPVATNTILANITQITATGGYAAGGNGFVIVDTAPRLWWKRKPKALPEDEAEQQVKRVAGVIERIAREQVASPEPASVQREQARQAVAPLVRDMPGFDWSAMYRAAIAALIQQRLEEQARLIAAQEIERIRLLEADEDDVLILLMAA